MYEHFRCEGAHWIQIHRNRTQSPPENASKSGKPVWKWSFNVSKLLETVFKILIWSSNVSSFQGNTLWDHEMKIWPFILWILCSCFEKVCGRILCTAKSCLEAIITDERGYFFEKCLENILCASLFRSHFGITHKFFRSINKVEVFNVQ